MYVNALRRVHRSTLSDSNTQPARHTCTHNNLITSHWHTSVIFSQGTHSSLYATCGLIPLSNISSPHIELSVCLFTAPQRLSFAPGVLRHRPTDPVPYRSWHLAVYVPVHPSFLIHDVPIANLYSRPWACVTPNIIWWNRFLASVQHSGHLLIT